MDEANNEPVVVEGVTITNPHKVLSTEPTVTKLDVVRYYSRLAERMFPYVGGRVLSIVRCPQGIKPGCFFRRHPGFDTAAGISQISVPSKGGEAQDYFYLQDAHGLIAEAQMDTLEFHVWGSRVEHLEQPDIMVFDLDPDVGLGLEQVRRGAYDLKGILDARNLTSFIKTSGHKGYHVVVPLKPTSSWDEFHAFARRIAQIMAEMWPDRYTSNLRKGTRTGKIFIDWLRNSRGSTCVAPYSLRARTGTRVSMPLTWDEVDTIAPNGIAMAEALARVEGADPDPWAGYFQVDQSLTST